MDGKTLLAEVVRASSALQKDERDEMAVPSYTHWNPLIRWLFWKRLEKAVELGRLSPESAVLDVGCGSGLLLSMVSPLAKRAAGIDLNIRVAKAVLKRAGAGGVALRAAGAEKIPFPKSSFDVIFCLDVLEHVRDVAGAAREINRVMKKDGRAVISVPTENLIYKLGRLAAGFSGEYHHRGAADVEKAFSKNFAVSKKVFLPSRFLPLFELFVAEKA